MFVLGSQALAGANTWWEACNVCGRVTGTKGGRPGDSDTGGGPSRSSDSEALNNKIEISARRVCGANDRRGRKGIRHIQVVFQRYERHSPFHL